MSVEQQIEQLDDEIKALKASFEQNANSMEVFTTETTFDTRANIVNASNSGSYSPLDWSKIWSIPKDQYGNGYGTETIVVTFNCTNGINTFASLEFTVLAPAGFNIASTKRIPYNGGARWLIMIDPNLTAIGETGRYSWSPTKLHIAVQSATRGTMEVKMLWD